ncbi:hypothetical protein ACHWQZ_G000746 [Mnemiopsis leidyi]
MMGSISLSKGEELRDMIETRNISQLQSSLSANSKKTGAAALLAERTGRYKETALHVAAELGDLRIVSCLCREGADIHAQDKDGNTPLHVAVLYGALDCVQYLCNRRADVNITGQWGCTPIFFAATRSVHCVHYLCMHGADVNARNMFGNTALHIAAKNGSLSSLIYLTTHGADKNQTGQDDYTALHFAALGGRLNCVRYLTETACADIHALNTYKNTALHLAARRGMLECVEYLCAHGADKNCAGRNGYTPLHYAVHAGKLNCVQLLCRGARAGVNCQDVNGNTALHVAVTRKRIAIVRFLLEQEGIDLVRENNVGKKPGDIAVKQGNRELVDLFNRIYMQQLLVLATSGKPTIQPNACLGNRTHGEKDPWFKRKTEANNLKETKKDAQMLGSYSAVPNAPTAVPTAPVATPPAAPAAPPAPAATPEPCSDKVKRRGNRHGNRHQIGLKQKSFNNGHEDYINSTEKTFATTNANGFRDAFSTRPRSVVGTSTENLIGVNL